VTQDQQLEVLDIQTTATANERSHQRPERDVEERRRPYRRSCPNPPARGRDTIIGALQAAAVGNRGADRTLVLLEEEAVTGGLSVISRLACSRYLKGGTS
jgi:hypothetical protein